MSYHRAIEALQWLRNIAPRKFGPLLDGPSLLRLLSLVNLYWRYAKAQSSLICLRDRTISEGGGGTTDSLASG